MFARKTIKEVLKEFNSNLEMGLSQNESEIQREKFGFNQLETKKPKTLLSMFFAQLNDILIYILIAAAVISALLGETSDAVIIAIVIVINATVGIIQESKAEKALDALKKLSTPNAVVKRGGEVKEIPSREVVPGDIIIIDAGRYVPCDLRLLETANLKIEESTLTGESVPVDKDATLVLTGDDIPLGDQKNMLFMSTLATYGRGIGIAVSTGMNTEIGKIAKMLDEKVDTETPLQKKLAQLGKFLGIGALFICALMFVVGVLQKRDLFEMLLTSISLAVAAIPEGLPAIVTIVLAMGVQKMIKKNAIVRKLPAVETLGSVNIICSDKTGTLTQNKMTITKFYAGDSLGNIETLNLNDKEQKLLLENLILCNDATYSENSKTGDPTEIALLVAGAQSDIFKDDLEKKHPRIDEIPFESDRKLMTTVNKYDDEYYVMTKGAIDNLLNICTKAYIKGNIVPITPEIKKDIIAISNNMSDDALRVLGAAYKILKTNHVDIDSLESDLILVGLVGMIDPPRLEVRDSIAICHASGIKTVMITGDHQNTAFAIAKELNITNDSKAVMSGTELDRISDEELNNRIDNIRVFARVSPEHKVKIIKAFKSKGNIVSMTGDGVNDAPSLKIANIGVAMGITGTDVAKGAADMVLMDDNFSTIVAAIKEGRNIFRNIKKTVIFLISCNVGEIIALFFAILLGWASPLRPIHILWVNLITDTLPALALGIDPGDPDVMKYKPRNPKDSLFKNGILSLALNGLLIGILTLAAFIIGAKYYSGDLNLFPLFPKGLKPDALEHAQTMAFVVLSCSQLIHSLNMRNEKKSIFQIGLFSNKYLIGSIILGLMLQIFIITIPPLASAFSVHALSMNDWGFVTILSLMPLILNEIVKMFKRLSSKTLKN
ncbi:cation-translocating P-type ATPase [Clostridium estertheticum]|uniref:cation-translocating P-type ATPase n=1 Tax=Clostridium estertheticum TaxID=238834 RepID=UPI001CF532FB|nr:cation-translocating P-type ATPase [Clostridium estertheticum]MCB2339696.1 cation-translocating P-type ATPase [Clostridium estertheticum]